HLRPLAPTGRRPPRFPHGRSRSWQNGKKTEWVTWTRPLRLATAPLWDSLLPCQAPPRYRSLLLLALADNSDFAGRYNPPREFVPLAPPQSENAVPIPTPSRPASSPVGRSDRTGRRTAPTNLSDGGDSRALRDVVG